MQQSVKTFAEVCLFAFLVTAVSYMILVCACLETINSLPFGAPNPPFYFATCSRVFKLTYYAINCGLFSCDDFS